MFRDGKVVDPFFDKNVITDWVNNKGSKKLFIPEKMQHPWTGRGDSAARSMPNKRVAGQTKRGGTVPGFEDFFHS